jgi:hypothetical protein
MQTAKSENLPDDRITRTLGTVLAALYLPGLDRPAGLARARWQGVCDTLRRHDAEVGSCAEILGAAGFWEESTVLGRHELLTRSECLLESGRVLSAVSAQYPSGWLRLGRSAPPALWLSGPLPKETGLTIVGSRKPPPSARAFARELAGEAVRLGMAVVSGGAPGCDTLAAQASNGHVVEIVPCGLNVRWGVGSGVRMSARPPDEPFSTAAAMERNNLLYAFGECSAVCHARFKTGGAWLGASEALRKRLGRVLIWADESSLASRALIALGGIPLASPMDLERAMAASNPQTSLFPH